MRNFEFEGRIQRAIRVHENHAKANGSYLRGLRIRLDGSELSKPLKEISGNLSGTPTHPGEPTGGDSDRGDTT